MSWDICCFNVFLLVHSMFSVLFSPALHPREEVVQVHSSLTDSHRVWTVEEEKGRLPRPSQWVTRAWKESREDSLDLPCGSLGHRRRVGRTPWVLPVSQWGMEGE